MNEDRCDVWLVRGTLRGWRLIETVVAVPPQARGLPLGRRCGACGGTDHGRPILPWPDAPSVSVSYTDGWSALVLARGRVGVDIERCGERPALDALAEWVWTPAEYEERRGRADWRTCLFRDWTRKEALLKAHGVGLSVSMASFEVGGRIARVPGMPPLAVTDLASPPGLVGAVAAAPSAEVRVRIVSGPITPRRY